MTKIAILFIALSLALPALACMDTGYSQMSEGKKLVKELAYHSRSFGQCIDKLAEQSGVNHPEKSKSLRVYRKERDENSSSPILYTYKIILQDKEGRLGQMLVDYDMSSHRFVCKSGFSTNLPRCGG